MSYASNKTFLWKLVCFHQDCAFLDVSKLFINRLPAHFIRQTDRRQANFVTGKAVKGDSSLFTSRNRQLLWVPSNGGLLIFKLRPTFFKQDNYTHYSFFEYYWFWRFWVTLDEILIYIPDLGVQINHKIVHVKWSCIGFEGCSARRLRSGIELKNIVIDFCLFSGSLFRVR